MGKLEGVIGVFFARYVNILAENAWHILINETHVQSVIVHAVFSCMELLCRARFFYAN